MKSNSYIDKSLSVKAGPRFAEMFLSRGIASDVWDVASSFECAVHCAYLSKAGKVKIEIESVMIKAPPEPNSDGIDHLQKYLRITMQGMVSAIERHDTEYFRRFAAAIDERIAMQGKTYDKIRAWLIREFAVPKCINGKTIIPKPATRRVLIRRLCKHFGIDPKERGVESFEQRIYSFCSELHIPFKSSVERKTTDNSSVNCKLL